MHFFFLPDGICFPGTYSTITQTFSSDNTYTYLQIDRINTGNIISTQRIEEEGTYVITGSTLTATSDDGDIVTLLTIVDNGRFLDWISGLSPEGCDRILRFGR